MIVPTTAWYGEQVCCSLLFESFLELEEGSAVTAGPTSCSDVKQ